MVNDPLLLFLFHVIKEFSLHNFVEFRLLIHKVDHAKIYIVRSEACQQIRESLLHLRKIPRADILTILPGRADMPLDDPALSFASNGFSNIRTYVWLGHPAVQNIDPITFTTVDYLFDFFLVMTL